MRRPRRGRALVAAAGSLVAASCALGLGLAQGAIAAPAATPANARLEGPYELAGQITVAQRVPGERRGQHVVRAWSFFPVCPVGACGSVVLIRERAGGKDELTLVRLAPGLYAGAGRFFAPLRCGRRTYAKGQSVSFTIAVRVTAATALSSGAILATSFSATYTNTGRTNLTRCFSVLGHDGATYSANAVPVPGQT